MTCSFTRMYASAARQLLRCLLAAVSSARSTAADVILFVTMQEVIPTSLLKLSSENTGRAVKMFLGVQKFMGESSEGLPQNARFDLAQKLLHQVNHHGDKPYIPLYL